MSVGLLERFLRWTLIVWIGSFYLVVIAGFGYLGYWIAQYSEYLGMWVGAILFVLFSLTMNFFVLRIIQKVRNPS